MRPMQSMSLVKTFLYAAFLKEVASQAVRNGNVFEASAEHDMTSFVSRMNAASRKFWRDDNKCFITTGLSSVLKRDGGEFSKWTEAWLICQDLEVSIYPIVICDEFCADGCRRNMKLVNKPMFYTFPITDRDKNVVQAQLPISCYC